MTKMNKKDVENLLLNGKPGATSITQYIDMKLKTWWVPTLNDMPVSSGNLEKFDNCVDATIRSIEIKRDYTTAQQPNNAISNE